MTNFFQASGNFDCEFFYIPLVKRINQILMDDRTRLEPKSNFLELKEANFEGTILEKTKRRDIIIIALAEAHSLHSIHGSFHVSHGKSARGSKQLVGSLGRTGAA